VHAEGLSPSAQALITPTSDEPLAPSSASAVEPGRDLRSFERSMIEQALKDARYNRSKAARQLGLTRHQLYIRMRRHGLES
jgi:two-component system response regulator HydG